MMQRNLNRTQITGSGLALILISLLLYIFLDQSVLIQIAFVLVIWLMIWPAPFRYFAYFWFALGEAMGYVVSRVLLSLIFFLLVVPVGLMKRNQLRSNMKLNSFKTGSTSVFVNRETQFTEKDFEKPF